MKTNRKYKLQLRNGGYFIIRFYINKNVHPILNNDFIQEFLETFINRQIEANKYAWLREHPNATNQDLSWI